MRLDSASALRVLLKATCRPSGKVPPFFSLPFPTACPSLTRPFFVHVISYLTHKVDGYYEDLSAGSKFTLKHQVRSHVQRPCRRQPWCNA